jgi:hypothetical protein
MLALYTWLMAHGLVSVIAFNVVLQAAEKLMVALGVPVPAWLKTLCDWLTGNLPHAQNPPAAPAP